MHDFRKLATMTPAELARLSPTVAAPHGIGLGPDASQFETVASDPAATAAAIVAAAAKARGGGDTLAPKLSAAAEAILRAGRDRRGG
jgi:hypothetical protein